MMGLKMQTIITVLFSLFSFSFSRPDHGGIAIYWGQNNGDGTLTSTCDSKNYKIVILAFLNKFGAGRTPDWNFAGHCDHGAFAKCTELQTEIEYCQKKDIKVFLSIGGAAGFSDYSLSSAGDAKDVANYLYDHFLNGNLGPLGRVFLDGIDFDIEKTEDHWDDLVKELDALRHTRSRYFYLSAAPQCPIPVPFLSKAIATGYFNYIFVQFYNNRCSYTNGDIEPVLKSWDQWAKLVPSNNSLFVGLLASKDGGSGYIPPDVVNKDVLKHVKDTPNYEGVMLWDRFLDIQNKYSDDILPNVLKPVLRSVTSISDSIYECISVALNRVIPIAN